MFANCNQLISLNISSFSTVSAIYIENMFKGYSQLESLDLSNFDGSSVEDIHSVFQNCEQLKSIDLSNFGVPKVTNMNNMFDGCISLEYLDLSNFNPASDILESVEGMFDKMINIKYINIYNIQNEILKEAINSNFYTKNDLVICQSEIILNNNNTIYACCDFTKSPLKGDSNNYMIVKYKDAVNYTSGFSNDNCPSRNKIIIINEDLFFKNY